MDLPVLLLLAYLIGSIPSGLIVARLFRIKDPRTVGSQNIGATNMVRAGGKKVGAITLLLDMLKAMGIVILLHSPLFPETTISYPEGSESVSGHSAWSITAYYAIGLIIMIGHCSSRCRSIVKWKRLSRFLANFQ